MHGTEDLGDLVTLPPNFQSVLLFLAPHSLAIKCIWCLQCLCLLRVLWCELACFLLASLPAGRMEKHLAEWRKRKPKIVTSCHPLSIFERCADLSDLLPSPLCPMDFLHFYSFTLISGSVYSGLLWVWRNGRGPHLEGRQEPQASSPFRTATAGFQAPLQSYSHQDSMVPAQGLTYRLMEQNRK